MKSSEVRAYIFIKEQLQELGWNVSNPLRNSAGQVYTQHECLKDELIKKYLLRDVPENVIRVRERKFMIVESKAHYSQIDLAEKEVKEYADKMNSDEVLAPIATALAGNPEETYVVKNFYFIDNTWKEIVINHKITGGLLSPDIAQKLVDKNTYELQDIQISDEILYTKATKINEILHTGSINKNYRARVIAALLLAMADDVRINIDNEAFSLINEINSKAEKILHQHGKQAFAKSIQISTPPTPDNHIKFRKALIDTIQELESLNIRSAMNSGADILGRFYEIFLKYGNGAKEIGIVLTPRHITKFAAESLRVNKNDKVFDPACGTGGFLVASYDLVKKNTNENELDSFKQQGIYGIEQEPEVVALSLVNMIFRGDGKNNIVEGNCFTTSYFKDLKVTKVLMNPPFALKKEDEKEYKFIDFALDKLETGGLLFAIVPSPIMFRGKNYKDWRVNLLRNHSVKAVIKLPEDLFYPVGVHTSALILKAHIPHKQDSKVLWGILKDGYLKRKGVMFFSEKADANISKFKQLIHNILDGDDIEEKLLEWAYKPIEYNSYIECAPEGYIEDEIHSNDSIVEGMREVLLNAFSANLSNRMI